MKILESIAEFTDPRQPLVLTIGNFDGMHRGHAAVIKKVKELAGNEGQSLVITFRNHPSEILRPDQPAPLICTLAHKLKLLEETLIDQIILLTFTRYLAQHNAGAFIESIRQTIPFTHLILGYDATLGRDKLGDRAKMMELGDLWGFTPFYLEEHRFEGKPVSSSAIRELLQQGDLQQVSALLNRPYSIYAPVIPCSDKEISSSLPIRIDVTGLCLPPAGRYAIEIREGFKRIEGTAVLKAATQEGKPKEMNLEIILQDETQKLNSSFLEIMFNGLSLEKKDLQ